MWSSPVLGAKWELPEGAKGDWTVTFADQHISCPGELHQVILQEHAPNVVTIIIRSFASQPLVLSMRLNLVVWHFSTISGVEKSFRFVGFYVLTIGNNIIFKWHVAILFRMWVELFGRSHLEHLLAQMFAFLLIIVFFSIHRLPIVEETPSSWLITSSFPSPSCCAVVSGYTWYLSSRQLYPKHERDCAM